MSFFFGEEDLELSFDNAEEAMECLVVSFHLWDH